MTEKIKFFVGDIQVDAGRKHLSNLENEIQQFLKSEREKYGEVEIRESGVALYGTTIVFYIRYRTR
jgi:hypothetical protein